jgi:hypothetical protein
MSRKSVAVLLGGGLALITVCAVSALLITRAAPEASLPNAKVLTQQRVNAGGRNLFLQPEALRVSRRLGKRFDRSSRATTTSVGTLTLGGNQLPLTLTRRQIETGESVELLWEALV